MVLAFCLFVALAVSLYGVWRDFKSLTIPNEVSLIVFLFFVVGFLYSQESFGPWWHYTAGGILMFAISFVMFAIGIMGGGDSKLASAWAFWIGLKEIVVFVFVMSLIGGVLALVSLMLKRFKLFKNPDPQSWIAVAQSGSNDIPYTIPVFIGAIVALLSSDFLQKRIFEVISIFY